MVDFMEALDLRDVTLVGNDTGGAICQIVVAEHPKRIGRLVLTNCDAYEAFFPLVLRPLQYGARLFGERFSSLLAWALKHRFAQRIFLWTVARRKVDEKVLDAYFSPFLRDPGVRRDARRFLRAASNATSPRPNWSSWPTRARSSRRTSQKPWRIVSPDLRWLGDRACQQEGTSVGVQCATLPGGRPPGYY